MYVHSIFWTYNITVALCLQVSFLYILTKAGIFLAYLSTAVSPVPGRSAAAGLQVRPLAPAGPTAGTVPARITKGSPGGIEPPGLPQCAENNAFFDGVCACESSKRTAVGGLSPYAVCRGRRF